METPIEGGKVTISLPGEAPSKFNIRIVTENRVFVSPENDINAISILIYSPSVSKWTVSGSDLEYMITFDAPVQVRGDFLENSNLEMIRDSMAEMYCSITGEVDTKDFEAADSRLDNVKSTLFQQLTLWLEYDFSDLYGTPPDITKNELYQRLDWIHKHGAVYGGYLLLYYLEEFRAPQQPTIPMTPTPFQGVIPMVPITQTQWQQFRLRLYDVIDWIFDHNVPVDFDPRNGNGDILRPELRNAVIYTAFINDDDVLFQKLFRIPKLFDFISNGYYMGSDAMSFIEVQILTYKAAKIKESLIPTTKAFRKQ
jgi:hypothetical protein